MVNLSLPKHLKSTLHDSKNLLAFSAGVDSTALFFMLLKENISFDIAIVDFQIREQSKLEVDYAKELSFRYNKKCFVKKVSLDKANFEHNARLARYEFFKELIKLHNYQNLLTAHQLNDRLEWFLMQLSKGAGLVEMLGFEMVEKRDGYNLIRPLIENSKDELLKFLHNNNIKYFIDKTNFDKSIKRNAIRYDIANDFIKEYQKGIIKSFRYLKRDSKKLYDIKIIKQIKDLYILKNLHDIRQIDKVVKLLGYILSSAQREEIIKNKDVVISDKIAIVIKEELIYISPYYKVKLDKEFKEKCRVLKIPPKIRGYLKKEQISPNLLKECLI